jgi:hypothetical protein
MLCGFDPWRKRDALQLKDLGRPIQIQAGHDSTFGKHAIELFEKSLPLMAVELKSHLDAVQFRA